MVVFSRDACFHKWIRDSIDRGRISEHSAVEYETFQDLSVPLPSDVVDVKRLEEDFTRRI